MKITDIYESTTSGSVATVAQPMTTQSRNASIYGSKKGGNLLTGKKTNKKYANSVHESKMKQVAMDLETMQDGNFKQKYKKTKEQIKMLLGDPNAKKTVHENEGPVKYKVVYFNPKLDRTITKTVTAKNESDIWDHCANKGLEVVSIEKAKKAVSEAHLEEDDLILVPGQGHKLKSGFIPHGESRLDHEVEMARSDLFSAAKNAKQVYELIADVTEEEGLEGWVQEKIIKANDYLNTIREYLEGKQLQNEMTGGVIAAGGVGEGIVDKIKGAVRREKAKDLPLVQTRRDYAMGKGGDAYNKGETRKGNQYMAYAEKDRKKKGDPTTNPAGTYRTKTTDYKG